VRIVQTLMGRPVYEQTGDDEEDRRQHEHRTEAGSHGSKTLAPVSRPGKEGWDRDPEPGRCQRVPGPAVAAIPKPIERLYLAAVASLIGLLVRVVLDP
jgi:hypothetical protein